MDNKFYNDNQNADNNLLLMVLDNIDTGIHIVNANGITLYYNKAAESIDGIKKEDILGKSMYELVKTGVFSRSVALEVIENRKRVNITQKINNRLIYAIGTPVFEDNILSKVIVYCRNIETLEILGKQLEELKKENERITQCLSRYNVNYLSSNQLLSRSKEMRKIIKLADRIAVVNSTVLLEGESGVGKSMIAKYIHEMSNRKNKPFVKLDCSSIPESLIESELFGYEEGAFTGAVKGGKKGLIYIANKGTLFLDEIGELPLTSQVKLLTILQDRQIQPIGSTDKIDIDVRIISATNQNLEKLVDNGEFRKDLYYRLRVIPITIPPLRQRRGDIIPLIRLFVARLNKYYGFKKNISPSGIRILLDYSWPGNVRELENAIERLIVTTEGEVINEEDILQSIRTKESINMDEEKPHKDRVIDYEKNLIVEYSSHCNSIREMANFAKIDESTLRKKIDRYSIDLKFK